MVSLTHFAPKPGQGGYRALLLTMVGLLIGLPLMETFGQVTLLFPIFFTGLMLASVWAVSGKPRQVIAIAALALASVIGEWLLFSGRFSLDAAIALAELIVLIWTAVIIGKDVFGYRDSITADIIYGGINVYLLMTIAFSAAYRLLVLMFPGSIEGLSVESTMTYFLYFSAVTMTTLGFGDITPIGGNARMMTYLQAITGQLFIAILMAKLVATYLTGNKSNRD